MLAYVQASSKSGVRKIISIFHKKKRFHTTCMTFNTHFGDVSDFCQWVSFVKYRFFKNRSNKTKETKWKEKCEQSGAKGAQRMECERQRKKGIIEHSLNNVTITSLINKNVTELKQSYKFDCFNIYKYPCGALYKHAGLLACRLILSRFVLCIYGEWARYTGARADFILRHENSYCPLYNKKKYKFRTEQKNDDDNDEQRSNRRWQERKKSTAPFKNMFFFGSLLWNPLIFSFHHHQSNINVFPLSPFFLVLLAHRIIFI